MSYAWSNFLGPCVFLIGFVLVVFGGGYALNVLQDRLNDWLDDRKWERRARRALL